MKKLREWIRQLPAEFRNSKQIQDLNSIELQMDFPCMKTALNHLSQYYEYYEYSDSWNILMRRYAKHAQSSYHISYWTAHNLTTGINISAVNIAHAVELFELETHISQVHIMYILAKESKYES